MKSYYYFVRNPHKFSVKDVVFRVSVGSSQRDLIKLALVQEWSRDSGAYFKIQSDQSSRAVHNLAENLFPDSKCPSMLLHWEKLSISQLYRSIIDWSWDLYENNTEICQGQHHILNLFLPSSLISKSVKASKRVCQSVSRKYLSDEVSESPLFAAINFGLILLLFLFTAFIDKVFGF